MKILKFYAPWCGPCKTQGEILKDLDDVVIENINVDEDENEELCIKYKITSMPVLVLLNDADEIIKQFVGLTPIEQIKEAIKQYEKQS